MKVTTLFTLLFVYLFSLTGCQSPKISLETIGSMDNSKWVGDKSYDVLVVGYAYETSKRIAFEDQMTRALRRVGINAEASHITYPAMNSINSQTLDAYLQGADNRAVFFAHALSITRQDHSSDRIDESESIFGSDHHSWEVQIGAIIEAAVYVKEIKAAVWLNRTRFQSETSDGGSAMQRYAGMLIREMQQADVISRLK